MEMFIVMICKHLYVLKSSFFCDIMPCSPLKVSQSFGGMYHLHLNGQRISQARNQHEALVLLKRLLTLSSLHGVISPKIALFITTTGESLRSYIQVYCLQKPTLEATTRLSLTLLHLVLFYMWFVNVLSSKLLLLFISDVPLFVWSVVMGIWISSVLLTNILVKLQV
jgi:membrane protein insertase Oxa1/YidC/SpoIIIJ